LSKKYGTPKKETLKQPGYKPVSPKNLDAKSAFALQLEQIPVKDMAVRTVDFGQDIVIKPLNNHVTLYYKDNPVNDVFTFTLRYKDGELHTPALSVLGSCLSQLGTDSLNRQQLGQAWQRIGATMEVVPGDVAFSINLTGPDKQLVPALRLLAHFLRSAKGDQKALKDAKDEDRIDRKSFGKQKDDVLRPAIHRIAYGERSSYLKQLSRKEVKALKNEDLMALFRELQQYDCELFYCGRQPIEYVAAQAQQALPLSQCTKPQADTFRPFLQYDEPVVYFYHVPKSRQNYIVSYDAIGALPTQEERVKFKLWDEYFGGGMSSVLFQNVREFRSLAYATGGSAFTTSLAQHSDASQGYVTVTGTQADKTLEALSTVDSLLRQLPMKENNLEAARQSVLNDIQNNYPTFRTLGKYVANQLRDGYVSDPNTGIARGIPSVTSQDIMQFHQKHVTSNKNRIWIVIGDRKLTDMKALARYGKVVELRKEDVYR
jgi:predicted Zn-dependent peptidase